MTFKDHFSRHAQSYALARPQYPDELFSYLRTCCAQHSLAWDCATGNGQAALSLARYFGRVVATDASAEQIAQALPAVNVEYAVMPAENPTLEGESVDLIAVAQALHWFNIDAFFVAADRVLKKQGVLAVWSYGQHEIDTEVDAIVHRLYADIVGDYWPTERCMVEARYEGIEFPYTLMSAPSIEMHVEWSLQQLLGYLMSWSAVQRFIRASGENPLEQVNDQLREAWGRDPVKKVSWPLTLNIGRK
ncbi:MAG: class I SAM-dependent methyltransferase [Proteobacteria bacterium]|nr:class I SAM-dependent methyltransferase [Pseudomonadota bacterium]